MERYMNMMNEGLEYVKLSEYRAAIRCFEQAVIPYEHIRRIINTQLAICHINLDEYDRAEELLLRCVNEKNPVYDGAMEVIPSESPDWKEDQLEVYDLLVVIYERTGDEQKLINVYDSIIALVPEHVEARIKLFELNDRNNNLYESLRHFEYLQKKDKVDDALFVRAYDIAYKLMEYDKALGYADIFLGNEDKLNNNKGLYQSMLLHSSGLSLYTEHHSNEDYVVMLKRIYSFYKPISENSFCIDRALFRTIRIGFISSDFKYHPVGNFVSSIFEYKHRVKCSEESQHLNEQFEYFCYYTREDLYEDVVTKKIKSLSDHFAELGELTDEEIEKAILNDNLDILFDLNGLSTGNKARLLAKRLAPIQISWIGWPGSTGIPNIDYTIVDSATDPPEYSSRLYTEDLIYMTKTFLCYPYEHLINVEKAVTAPCIKNGYITFGSFNNCSKYSDKTLSMWAIIMRRLSNARLIVRASDLQDEISKNAFINCFRRNGINMERVEFRDAASYDQYLLTYNEVDIILDTYPFNGATTTVESFYMGVPVISMYGERHVSRVGLSLLGNVNLAELAVSSEQAYINKAVELATDVRLLEMIRSSLNEAFRYSPLVDIVTFNDELHNNLRGIFIKYCETSEISETNSCTQVCRNDLKEMITEIYRALCFLEKAYNMDELIIDGAIRELSCLQNVFYESICHKKIFVERVEILNYYKKSISFLSQKIDLVTRMRLLKVNKNLFLYFAKEMC